MTTPDTPARTVKTADTVFAIVEYLSANPRSTPSEIATDLDLAKSTVHTHLATLVSKEYALKDNHRYRLSLRFLDHGQRLLDDRSIVEAADGVLDELAEETGEISWLVAEEHGYGVYLANALGEGAVQTVGRIGKRMYLHCTSTGKAILAHLPESRQQEILERHGLPTQTDRTIIDRDGLSEELERIREQGVAFNDREATSGTRSVACPIFHSGSVEGAVSVAGPANRITDEYFRDRLPEIVSGAANTIELKLEY